MKRANQNLKESIFGKSNFKKLNFKKLNLKIPNPKNLALICIATLGLAFGACNADIDKPNTNPLTDKKIQMDCFADKSARNDKKTSF